MSTIIVIGVLLIIALVYYNHKTSQQQADLLKKYWTDHIIYTRLVIEKTLSSHDGKSAPQAQQFVNRLLQNQSNIGSVFATKYGTKVGGDVTAALTDHINKAYAVLTDIRLGKSAATDIASLYSNAQTTGSYLDKLFNSGSRFTTHMKTHIDTLVANVTSFDTGQDVATLDPYIACAEDMANDMASYF